MPSSEIKIEIITERIELTNDGIGTGVWVDVCTRCSSLVLDPVAHDKFHRTWHRA